jgi:hypothetical protein
MITREQYFGPKPHTKEHAGAAEDLLVRVNTMLSEEFAWHFPIDHDTGTPISGARNGNGDGGFRLPAATTGRTASSHKEARGVDVYDPENWLDNQLSRHDEAEGRGNKVLEKYGLYREAPQCTITWCHLSTRPPPSGKRTFYP